MIAVSGEDSKTKYHIGNWPLPIKYCLFIISEKQNELVSEITQKQCIIQTACFMQKWE